MLTRRRNLTGRRGNPSESGGSSAPAVVVDSIEPDIGSRSGGGATRTITGSGFTGQTSGTAGGTPFTAFDVIDDEHVEVTMPAHAAGAVDIVIGGSTLAAGYEYWDPGAETFAQLHLGGNYVTTPSPSWPALSGTALVHIAGGSAPTAVNGSPDFEFTGGSPLGNSVNLSTWAGTGSCTLIGVVNAESVTVGGGPAWTNHGIISTPGGYLGLFLEFVTGQYRAMMYSYDGAPKTAVVNVSSLIPGGVGWLAVQGKTDGGTLYIRAIGAAGATTGWVSGSAVGTNTGPTQEYRVGGAALSAQFDGVIMVAGSKAGAVWSDTAAAKFEKWARVEYGP